jgi:hypothetical protein
MIGSLVVVFPTPHEGGALVLRHAGKEWTFDSASLVASHQKPHVGFIAFFSDVEHEVTRIVSGHRVTLTYNIYKEERGIGQTKGQRDVELERVFRELLGDTSFMPEGGNLGFGLRHQYPILRRGEADLKVLSSVLKGSDATLFRVSKQLGLKSSFEFYIPNRYGPDYPEWLCPYIPDLSDYSEQDNPSVDEELQSHGARLLTRRTGRSGYVNDEEINVDWVTKPTSINRASTVYTAYGNEATVGHIYGDACFIIEVDDLQARALVEA